MSIGTGVTITKVLLPASDGQQLRTDIYSDALVKFNKCLYWIASHTQPFS